MVDPEHVAAINSQQHTSTLPTAEPVIADACLSDRVTSAKLRICAFLAEHCLPFSLSPDLIDLVKTLGSDQESCKQLSMCRKTASYTLTHGLARSVILKVIQIAVTPSLGRMLWVVCSTTATQWEAKTVDWKLSFVMRMLICSGWLPNHFVVCLPDETQGESQLKCTPRKRPAGTDIQSFFNKFPRSHN